MSLVGTSTADAAAGATSGATALRALITQLGSQHKAFLEATASTAMETLVNENGRLEALVAQLQSRGGAAAPLPQSVTSCFKEFVETGQFLPGTIMQQDSAWTPVEQCGFCTEPRANQMHHKTQTNALLEGILPPMPAIPGNRAPKDERLHGKRNKERRRLCVVLGLAANTPEDYRVAGDLLRKAMKGRMDCQPDNMDEVVQDLRSLRTGQAQAGGQTVRLGRLLDVMLASTKAHEGGLSVYGKGEGDTSLPRLQTTRAVVDALNMHTVEDIVQTAIPQQECLLSDTKAGKQKDDWWVSPLNMVVTCCICINLLALGASSDFDPTNPGWVVIDAFCSAVFIFEAVCKIRHAGIDGYFKGKAWRWNTGDFFIAMISAFEVMLELFPQKNAKNNNLGQAIRTAVLFRVLRLARIFRLMRLVNSPLLRDLANMIVGLAIGIPGLITVLVLLFLTVALVGIFSRLALGPLPGHESRIDHCGYADFLVDTTDPTCLEHELYGEEYFGSVAKAMFTVFRWMLGDYNTLGGRSLVVALSRGYGMKFECAFSSWMIVVMFGLFNIITAVFVEGTISGLRHNDTKRKQRRQYEKAYVRKKLENFVDRVVDLIEQIRNIRREMECLECDQSRSVQATQSEDQRPDDSLFSSVLPVEREMSWRKKNLNTVALDGTTFSMIMADEEVRSMLIDLDIDMANYDSLFGTADVNNSGEVSLQELVEAMLVVRGEAQKSDLIASWLSSRCLHMKFDALLQHMHIASGNMGQSGSVTDQAGSVPTNNFLPP